MRQHLEGQLLQPRRAALKRLLHIGFTGTRQGMTEHQKSGICWHASHSGIILHHGDAVGADAEAHDIAVELDCGIVIHPPDDVRQRALKIAALNRAPRPYLDRNKVGSCAKPPF